MPRGELTPKAWVALWSVYIIWGSTYLAIRYVVKTMPPLLTAGTRFVIAGAIMYAIGIRRGDRSDRPSRRHWVSAAMIGTGLCLGGNGLVNLAENRGLASGTAALLIATVPLWLALFDAGIFRARIRTQAVAGILLGFGGTAILARPGGSTDVRAALYVVGAAAAWAAGSLYARRAELPKRLVVSTGMEMMCGGIALLVAAAIRNEFTQVHPSAFSASSIAALSYLIVFGSIVGFSAYVWLLRNVRTTIVGTYAYVNPFIAVLLGAVFADEKLTAITIVSGAIIVIAVALIVSVGPAPPRNAELGSQRLVS